MSSLAIIYEQTMNNPICLHILYGIGKACLGIWAVVSDTGNRWKEKKSPQLIEIRFKFQYDGNIFKSKQQFLGGVPMPEILQEISKLLQQGRAPAIKEKIGQAIQEGISAEQILNEGLLAGMDVIGERFKANKAFIPEVMLAARAMNMGLSVLKPLLTQSGMEAKGVVVIGTVKGDQHDIGKNLVRMMMEGKGLKVIDLGVDVPAAKYLEAAEQNHADIIACSALLTTTMKEMQTVVELVKGSPLYGKVKIMVGGAPVSQAFCDTIGADCYTPDAATAAEAALALCG